MELFDTHAHLYTEEFDADRAEALQRALEEGVRRIYLPNIDSSSIASMLRMEKEYPETCFPMMGLHPCSVNEHYGEELSIVRHWLSKQKFAAVGEIGLDYYWDKTFMEQQKDAFSLQIDLAIQYGLPIVIHQRDCFEEVIRIVERKNTPELKGIFHCFNGTAGQAVQVLSLGGFKLGIGGPLTYKNSKLPDVVRDLPLNSIVLETDAPYLPPVPYRGKRNESSYLKYVAEKLAQIKGISLEEVAEITTNNAREVFS